MSNSKQRRTDADRAYHVAMAALVEEIRGMQLPKAERDRRMREIYEICYGKPSNSEELT
jgi:hypothetical protein